MALPLQPSSSASAPRRWPRSLRCPSAPSSMTPSTAWRSAPGTTPPSTSTTIPTVPTRFGEPPAASSTSSSGGSVPSGRTHDLITLVTGAAAAPILLSSSLPDMSPPNATVFLTAYLASGLLFSPDLDLRSAPYRRWRKLRWIWLPYQKLVPHRSPLSHSLLLGPLLRILYFAAVLALLTLIALGLINLFVPIDPTGLLPQLTNPISTWIAAHPAAIAYALAGFLLGAASHTLADTVVTFAKRRT